MPTIGLAWKSSDDFILLNPGNAAALANRGFARQRLDKLPQAQSDFEAAFQSNPDTETRKTIEASITNIKAMLELERGTHGSGAMDSVDPDFWQTADAIEKLAKAYSDKDYPEVRSLLAILDGLKKTESQIGMCLYFEGEMLLLDGRVNAAHVKFLEASKLIQVDFYRSESLWKVANYYRTQDDAYRGKTSTPHRATRECLFTTITGIEPESNIRPPGVNARRAGTYARLSADLLPDNAVRNLQVGYLFLGIENDRMATRYFERALNNMTPTMDEAHIYLDMAYAYMRQENGVQLHHNLDDYILLATERNKHNRGQLTREQVEQLYGARRLHADVTRHWGMYSGLYMVSLENNDYAIQGINDLYWQPWYSNGKYAQVYWQLFDTFTGKFTSPISTPDRTVHYTGRTDAKKSLYTTLGVRCDLSTKYNLVMALERSIKWGTQTKHDTRIRLAHSWDKGLELQPWVRSWQYRTTFHEAIYSLQHDDWLLNGQVRAGRSHRLASNNRMVVSPHASLSYGYQGRGLEPSRSWYLDGGGGVQIRQWYRENKFNAPRSYWDIIIEYKAGLSHDRYNTLMLTIFNAY